MFIYKTPPFSTLDSMVFPYEYDDYASRVYRQGRWIAWASPPPVLRNGAEVLFHNNIMVISNFMAYQYRIIETNLLQLFVHPQNSGGFSTISVTLLSRSTLLLNKNKLNW